MVTSTLYTLEQTAILNNAVHEEKQRCLARVTMLGAIRCTEEWNGGDGKRLKEP